jgi:Oligonucleotide/oligosaccharide-binding (OB)-fold
MKWDKLPAQDEQYHTNIRRALARGFFNASAMRISTDKDVYITIAKSQEALLSPESVLVDGKKSYHRSPTWIIFTKFDLFAKQYLGDCTAIEPEWIADLDYFADAKLVDKPYGDYSLEKVRNSITVARANLYLADA